MEPPSTLSLRQLSSICRRSGAVAEALSDAGSMAMVVGRTGGTAFTRSLSKVLFECTQTHPIEKIIVDASVRYTHETGSDCNTFILLLHYIMERVDKMAVTQGEETTRIILLRECPALSRLLPDLFVDVRRTAGRFSCPDDHSFPSELAGVVRTFFSCRFGGHVLEQLVRLMSSFVSDSVLVEKVNDGVVVMDERDSDSISNGDSACDMTLKINSVSDDAFDSLICNFEALCSKVLAPVSMSTSVKGFVFPSIAAANLCAGDRFIVVSDLSIGSKDATWHVEDNFHFQLSKFWVSIERRLRSMRQFGITSILSSKIATGDLRALCQQTGLSLLDRLPEDGVAFLIEYTGMDPLDTLYDLVQDSNVVEVRNCRSVEVGPQSFLNFTTTTEDKPFVPNHVILCAPTDDMWKEYFTECLNCLKYVSKWLQSDIKMTSSAVEVPENSNGHETGMSSAGVSYPLGAFEYFLKSTFEKKFEILSSCRNLVDILNSSLLKVVCKLWNISYLNFDSKKSFEIQCKKNSQFLWMEPALVKETQLCALLQLLQQLCRIDSIVFSKKIA